MLPTRCRGVLLLTPETPVRVRMFRRVAGVAARDPQHVCLTRSSKSAVLAGDRSPVLVTPNRQSQRSAVPAKFSRPLLLQCDAVDMNYTEGKPNAPQN